MSQLALFTETPTADEPLEYTVDMSREHGIWDGVTATLTRTPAHLQRLGAWWLEGLAGVPTTCRRQKATNAFFATYSDAHAAYVEWIDAAHAFIEQHQRACTAKGLGWCDMPPPVAEHSDGRRYANPSFYRAFRCGCCENERMALIAELPERDQLMAQMNQ